MIRLFSYDKILKYQITATCTEPLHIGNADGSNGQVFVHPVDGIPLVQASSIAGVFRAYYSKAYTSQEANKLFGTLGKDNVEKESVENTIYQESRIRISDGSFCTNRDNLKLELRPRVKINPKTGSCDYNKVYGSGRTAGQKFNMEYVGTGAKITFSIYLYNIEMKEKLESVFCAIQQQQIQFGGQKSNGCGYLSIDQVLYKEFDMRNAKDRELWSNEETLEKKYYTDILPSLNQKVIAKNAYEITVTGQTENELLVKSITVENFGKEETNCKNVQNASLNYIIPGSSFKGTIRSHMEKIAEYLQVTDIIGYTFGISKKEEQEGLSGNIRFLDTIIGTREENEQNRTIKRIHIDKFTGGVMHGGLFSEKNVSGNVNFQIRILNKNYPERTCGLLLLALRDMAIQMLSIGSGRNVGKGFIDVKEIKIQSQEGTKAEISFPDTTIKDPAGIIKKCLHAVRGIENGISD